MSEHAHYFPVLRWKQAEWSALGGLSVAQKKCMTPLIEFTPSKFTSDMSKTDEQLENITNNWGSSPVLFDLNLLSPSVMVRALSDISRKVSQHNLSLIPVTALDKPSAYQDIIRNEFFVKEKRIGIRIKAHEVKTSNFSKNLSRLLQYLSINPTQVDLLIDYEIISSGYTKYADLCTLVPFIKDWRTFSVISGAFPKDLTIFKSPGRYTLPRADWNTWLIEISAKGMQRKPCYGDYTIQHPLFSEPVPGANPSASIRYTSEEYWVIMRGERLRNPGGPGYAQYPANAQILCAQNEFCGEDFSMGDRYIFDIGNQRIQKTGNPGTWLKAGVNHHLTFVINQLSNLSVA